MFCSRFQNFLQGVHAKTVSRYSLFIIFSPNFNFPLPKRSKLAYSLQLKYTSKNEQGKTADFRAIED